MNVMNDLQKCIAEIFTKPSKLYRARSQFELFEGTGNAIREQAPAFVFLQSCTTRPSCYYPLPLIKNLKL